MKESDVSDMALEALEALQNELANASGDVKKELSLIASIIDQKRAEDLKEREIQAQKTREEPDRPESTQPDAGEKHKEAQAEPIPVKADPPRTQTEGRSFAGWPKKDQWVHHPQQREHGHPSRFFAGLQALFFFSLLGPGLIFIYLMVILFTADPFPFRIN